MTILMKIKDDLLAARKSGHQVKKNLLSTLYAETAMLGKNNGNRPLEEITDEETIGVIKKFIKGAEEAHQICETKGKTEQAAIAAQELKILEDYLPAQLSDEFLEQFVKNFLEKSPQQGKQVIGGIMKELKQNYQGQFDGRKVNEIIARLI
ncbi:GatB/YqeY domain-containing protein [Dehalobacterium formicoaceticum]|uniref:GatB/YqeY domain-containing protein n=1 Tax=Dehalobacterium formicoaceticum TaxID=51515 RepID=UPI000B7CFF31|nr:GatB/YqeY domain-containing protein [Dehalobacterium formicoaceticum]